MTIAAECLRARVGFRTCHAFGGTWARRCAPSSGAAPKRCVCFCAWPSRLCACSGWCGSCSTSPRTRTSFASAAKPLPIAHHQITHPHRREVIHCNRGRSLPPSTASASRACYLAPGSMGPNSVGTSPARSLWSSTSVGARRNFTNDEIRVDLGLVLARINAALRLPFD